MPKTTTLQEFLDRAKIAHEGKYDYSHVKFKTLNDVVTIICPIHGKFQQRASVHIKDKCGCSKCGLENRKHPHKKNNKKFIIDAQVVHGDIYDYSKTDYKNANCNVVIICPVHGEFKQRPSAHITQKQGCPKCGLKKKHRKTHETFIQEAKGKWSDGYDYTNTRYIDKETKIVYTCPVHGEVKQKPYLHLKHGCQYCAGRGISRYNKETFIVRAKEVHGDVYDYSKVELESVRDYVTITCPSHGEFRQEAKAHINAKNGCPKCYGGIPLTNEEYIKKAKLKHNNKFDYSLTEYINTHGSIKIICPLHGEFTQTAYLHLVSIYGCPQCATESHSSQTEKEIVDFISRHYKGQISTNDRNNLDYKEIDIFLPQLAIGIEYHGNYWHTEKSVGKNYHLNKANIADKKHIKLIQIFEFEWTTKKDIVKSRLLSILGLNERIFARNTKVVYLAQEIKNKFLETTHIQGKDKASICFGLMHQDELVACMTFGKPRFNKTYNYELIRYSSKLNTNIIGGAGKLLARFRKDYPGTIISYADRRWSTGNLYKQLGFTKLKDTTPGYVYYHLSKKTTSNRLRYQKHILKKMPFYNANLTEYDIMKLNGYDRLWNAGNNVWVIE